MSDISTLKKVRTQEIITRVVYPSIDQPTYDQLLLFFLFSSSLVYLIRDSKAHKKKHSVNMPEFLAKMLFFI